MAKGHKDKVAVITGAANGIGQAFAKRLAEDGVHVAVVDVANGAATVKLVEAAGRQALRELRRVVRAIGRRHGQAGAVQIQSRRHRGQLRRHLPAKGFRRLERVAKPVTPERMRP
jgi:NAD(P)-dependent dehydrogenase (short-subunit alcohol dehydrogenase family)